MSDFYVYEKVKLMEQRIEVLEQYVQQLIEELKKKKVLKPE